MEPYQIENVLSLLITAAASLTALWMITRVWIHRRSRIGSGDLQKIVEAMQNLRDSVESMRLEVGDVAERLEFTERVLAQLVNDDRTPRPRIPPA
jgi:UDP-N-acetylglucosamine 2-epimerase